MNWILDVINFFSPHQWAVIGGFIAAALGTWGATALVKMRHLKKKGEKLWGGWVNLNVAVWGTLLTFVGAVLASLDQATGLLSVIPVAAPYAAKYGPSVSIFVLTAHTVITAVAKFWQARKAGEPISNVNYQPQSFGTEAAGVPRENLIQL